MNIRSSLKLLSSGAFLLASVTLSADWEVVEDFESIDEWLSLNYNVNCTDEDPDACNRVNELVTDPVTGSGTVGLFRAAPLNKTANWGPIALHEFPTPVTENYNGDFTVFFEFAIEDFRQDTVFGTHVQTIAQMEDDLTRSTFGGITAGLRVNVNTGGILEVRDEQSQAYVPISTSALETDTWYKVWLVHHNDHDFSAEDALSFDVYIEGGTEWPQQTLAYEGSWYRNELGAVYSFAIIQVTGGPSSPSGNSALYLKNMYLDPGASVAGGTDVENLEDPTAGTSGDTWAGYDKVGEGWYYTPHFGWIYPYEGTDWIFAYSLAGAIYSPEAWSDGTDGAWFYRFNPAPSTGSGAWAGYEVDAGGWAATNEYMGQLYVGTDESAYAEQWVYSDSFDGYLFTLEAWSDGTDGAWFYAIK